MGALTDVQIIKKDGKPAFAVIPYEEYLNLLPTHEDTAVPHEVVGLIIKKGMNLVKAWRNMFPTPLVPTSFCTRIK